MTDHSNPATNEKDSKGNGVSKLQNDSVPLVNCSKKQDNSSCIILQAITMAVFVLGLTQYVYGVVDHSSLMKMQFAASALAFISSVEHIWRKSSRKDESDMQSIYLLYRTAGTVFYIACLFLNLTHCLEEISDIKTSNLPENVTEQVEAHSHSDSNWTLYLSIIDLVIKLTFSFTFNTLSINYLGTFIALVSPSIFTLLVFFTNVAGTHMFFDWLDHHLEPVVSIALTIACIGIAIVSLIRKKQYLLSEGPKEFSIDKISESVKSKNENLEKIDHVHASCEWPQGFSVSLKAYIKVEKHNKDWVARAADDFAQLKSLLHTEIKAEGATEVIVEPVFVDRNENANFSDPICISPSCHNEDVGCCTNPKPTAETKA